MCRAAPELQTLELLTIRVENELQLLDPKEEDQASEETAGTMDIDVKDGEPANETTATHWMDRTPNVEYTMGHDGAYLNPKSPLFTSMDWKALEALSQYANLKFLSVQGRIEGCIEDQEFAFVADVRDRDERGVRTVKAWRRLYEHRTY